MTKRGPLIVDALEIPTPERRWFELWRDGGVGCVHITLAIWENARETQSYIAKYRRVLQENRDLVELAIDMVREEKLEDVADRAELNAEERLLDILLPAGPQRSSPDGARTKANDACGAPTHTSVTRACSSASGTPAASPASTT